MADPKDIADVNIAYWQLRPFWTDVLNLREPLPTTLTSYLYQFPKEDDEEFSDRCRKLAQINILDIIIESYLAMLFSTEVRITAKQHQDTVDRFTTSCNHTGDPLLKYFREYVAPVSLQFGHCDIAVDLPVTPDGTDILSMERQKAFGIDLPYCYVIQPLNRYAWSVDRYGNFVKYYSDDYLDTQIQANLGFYNGDKQEKQYTIWTLDNVTQYDSAKKEIDTRPNPFGYIPITTIIPIHSVRYQGKRLGKSLVQDVAKLQVQILNTMSMIYDFQEGSNYPMRILKQDTSDGDEPPTEGELAEQGNKRGLIIRGKDSDYWIEAPDPAGCQNMMNSLDMLIERAYQSVSMPSDANVNKTHQTGQTIRQNQSVLYNKLTMISKNLEDGVKQTIDMALRVQGIDPVEAKVSVQWGTNFSYESYINALEQLASMKQSVADMCPLAVSEFAKKAIAPQLYNSGKMDEIEAKFEDWVKRTDEANENPEPVDESQVQSLQKQNTEAAAADKITDQPID